jgi:hypothetical protein
LGSSFLTYIHTDYIHTFGQTDRQTEALRMIDRYVHTYKVKQADTDR